MSSNHRLPPVQAAPSALSASVELELDRKLTYHSEGVLGCSHYPRKCKLLAACCKQLYTCRLCHDEKVTDHKIDRHATEQVMCMQCLTLQPVAEVCEKCGVSFARYFCHICKFYDDTPDKQIYHCKDCGICRIGSTENTFHCGQCGVCMRVELREHKHIDKSLHSDCPICGENMFNSRDSIHYLPCGHSLHWKCFDLLYRQGGYGCPICKKSITDFTSVWRRFDRALKARPMPQIFEHAKVLVLCNDCDTKAESPFHYLGAKCIPCGSYNTTITGRINFPTQDEIIAWDEQERKQPAEPQATSSANGEIQGDLDPNNMAVDDMDLDLDLDMGSEEEFDEDAEIDIEQELNNINNNNNNNNNNNSDSQQ